MCDVLVLVPTAFELQTLQRFLLTSERQNRVVIELCGFGPIASAIGATRSMARHQPRQVILAGIAGAIGPTLPPGSVAEFSQIACYGIGAGGGSQFRSFQELGWTEWHAIDGQAFADVLQLDAGHLMKDLMVVSVCAASSDEADVANHLGCYPDAVAEDMESYSVAMACRAAGVAVRVFRGISNMAGDRDKSRWCIHAALEALAHRLNSELPS